MNAPGTFWRKVNEILKELQYARMNFDDIIVFSIDLIDHVQLMRIVLKRVYEAWLRLKLNRSEFAHSKVHFLILIMSLDGTKAEQGIQVYIKRSIYWFEDAVE